MPKKISEVAIVTKCREIDASPGTGSLFPSAIWEDEEMGLLCNESDAPDLRRFADAVTAMRQTVQEGDIIIHKTGVYRVNAFMVKHPRGLEPGVMAEQGIIVRFVFGNDFYFRYLSWLAEIPAGLKDLRKQVAAKTLVMPEYTEKSDHLIEDLTAEIRKARQSIDAAQQAFDSAKEELDAAWRNTIK